MEPTTLDSIDIQLLDQLQNDASLSNQALAARVHISPPTCLRRVKRLRDAGLIEREIAVLSVDQLANVAGHGLCAIVEITLDRQDRDAWEAFERRVAADNAVQQCYRVSPGPDFCLVVHSAHMPDYLALAQRLFTSDANVRNVKTFFSIKRSKFGARVPLPL
ncbi:Lrp/AsnC family transcriptional regulator [Rhodoferax sp. UBA5149]|uniref:Lrp/AsnC family transcriptional regulator n=1 Tax=Rhodoferax sp. UBA5149 TaxID=1947379 RepID=UPI0026000EE6|nr:Lrp/AsnC family transcriptional regulator [Rhodoferax sp. UBA5149]